MAGTTDRQTDRHGDEFTTKFITSNIYPGGEGRVGMVLLLSSARGGGPACRPGEINILRFMAKQPQVVSFVSFREGEGEGVSSSSLV